MLGRQPEMFTDAKDVTKVVARKKYPVHLRDNSYEHKPCAGEGDQSTFRGEIENRVVTIEKRRESYPPRMQTDL